MPNSTPRSSRAKSLNGKRKKPEKPAFPLWLHSATGQWAKKIRGKVYYFGTDQDKALAKYTREREDLEAGRTPRAVKPNDVTLKDLCNHFITNAQSKRDAGEITARTYQDYYKTCELILEQLGKTLVVDQIRPNDLMQLRRWLSARRSTVSLGNDIGRIRVVFNYAFNSGLVDRPVRFGDFRRPAKRVFRRQKASQEPKMFEPAEITTLIGAANQQFAAMILLGINCGLGNSDCAKLEFRHLDLEKGWLDFPRPKTGIKRRCPLWPETVAAIKSYLERRHDPKDPAHNRLVFITKYRGPWSVETSTRNPISAEFRKLLDSTGLYRPRRTFYALRHTFQTIADEVGDYLGTKIVMGHVDDSISGTYRERFPDTKLLSITDHVHAWLFPPEDKKGGAG